MAKKLSALKLRIIFFVLFSYYNFEDTVTNCEKGIFRKESLSQVFNYFLLCLYSMVQTLIVKAGGGGGGGHWQNLEILCFQNTFLFK